MIRWRRPATLYGVSGLLTRRWLLTAAGSAAVVVAAGCYRGEPIPEAGPDPLEPLIAAELALMATYDQIIARSPAVAARLTPVRADHAAHLDALRARIDPRRLSALPASAAPSPVIAPSTVAATMTKLVESEIAAAQRIGVVCLESNGELAETLASIAASEASHVVALR